MSQGVYRWNDGTIADYTNWRRVPVCAPARFNQPNDGQNNAIQDCIAIRSQISTAAICPAGGVPDNYWDDVTCFNNANEDNFDFVCERRPTC